ncbi:hypothetical protein BU26DRAFT_572848 [Trematosphaeria pertusa]|uniref:Uncharacterized protein n=1 Tax=Trematosphaeria pertusa TaxID=390896 RepID=A0A6A6HQQ5_9PLEO|nr:uncharacterized protein BU26DRAFT_572848 [Trematosphaeria pertusa]KAF2240351.1 hypothetical protein BU26DRAFT_572848 [Trematosphaeria pertusa]
MSASSNQQFESDDAQLQQNLYTAAWYIHRGRRRLQEQTSLIQGLKDSINHNAALQQDTLARNSHLSNQVLRLKLELEAERGKTTKEEGCAGTPATEAPFGVESDGMEQINQLHQKVLILNQRCETAEAELVSLGYSKGSDGVWIRPSQTRKRARK